MIADVDENVQNDYKRKY